MGISANPTMQMTSPIVTETSRPPEPVVPDPFIDDVTKATPEMPEQRRKRIWD